LHNKKDLETELPISQCLSFKAEQSPESFQ